MKRTYLKNLLQTAGSTDTKRLDLANAPLCEIDLNSIAYNARLLQGIIPTDARLLAVVKADAYGHGAYEVAHHLEEQGIEYFGVATVQEGVELRKRGIRGSILVLVTILPTEITEAVEHDLTVSVGAIHEVKLLQAISFQLGYTASAHITVDTGLSRGGFTPEQLNRALPELKRIQETGGIRIEGIWSHFATLTSLARAHELIVSFQALVKHARRFLRLPLVHLANSEATAGLPESHFNMVRSGLGLYGYLPNKQASLPLKPAMRITAPVVSTHRHAKGTRLSYQGLYTLQKPSTIATVRFGYADGYHLNLTNKSTIAIGDKQYPVVGKIMMDQLLVNLNDDRTTVGDRATLLGFPGPSAHTLAEHADLSPYCILTGFGRRIKKIYRRDTPHNWSSTPDPL